MRKKKVHDNIKQGRGYEKESCMKEKKFMKNKQPRKGHV